VTEQRGEGSPYYRAPAGVWPDIDGKTWEELVALQATLAAALDTARSGRPSPLDLALKLNEIAQGIFEQLAPDERDLRQIIGTLRTAHAVAWDMYDAVQATQVTVEQYMKELRDNIDSFENDLGQLQENRAA
jgi:hypothetical protein